MNEEFINEKSKKILITGCGSSGTHYITRLLKNFQLDVDHEMVMKPNGMISWWQTFENNNHDKNRNLTIKHSDYDSILHQVRHPLGVISSICSYGWRGFWSVVRNHIPISIKDNLLKHGMKYWYYWNLEAEKISKFTYQIENIENEIYRILDEYNIKYSNDEIRKKIDKINPVFTNKKLNSYKLYTWDDLENEDFELTQKIKELTLKYGYSLDWQHH
jgi:hypothetical protein